MGKKFFFFNFRKILELGAGSGMSGICCCKLFSPCRYTFTDHREDILEQLRQNLTLNQLGSNPVAKVANIDWLTLTETTAATWNDTDVIVASGRDFSHPLCQIFFHFFVAVISCFFFSFRHSLRSGFVPAVFHNIEAPHRGLLLSSGGDPRGRQAPSTGHVSEIQRSRRQVLSSSTMQNNAPVFFHYKIFLNKKKKFFFLSIGSLGWRMEDVTDAAAGFRVFGSDTYSDEGCAMYRILSWLIFGNAFPLVFVESFRRLKWLSTSCWLGGIFSLSVLTASVVLAVHFPISAWYEIDFQVYHCPEGISLCSRGPGQTFQVLRWETGGSTKSIVLPPIKAWCDCAAA